MTMTFLGILSYLGRIPALIVLVAGIVAALVFWHKARASALWAVVGFGILLLLHLFGWVQPWLIEQFHRSMGIAIGGLAFALSMVSGLINTAGLTCLLVSLIVAWKSRS